MNHINHLNLKLQDKNMKEIFGIVLKAILSIIFTILVFVFIVVMMPVAVLLMIVLMLLGLYEITVWIIKEIKNKCLWKVF